MFSYLPHQRESTIGTGPGSILVPPGIHTACTQNILKNYIFPRIISMNKYMGERERLFSVQELIGKVTSSCRG